MLSTRDQRENTIKENPHILYINSVSLSVCPGWYILNPCEQGVVFMFNMPSWMCLSVCVDKNWAVPGRFFQSLPVPCGASSNDFYFFRGGGRGWGWGSRGLNRWK